MMDQWRFINDSPMHGGRNMAVDVAILESVARGDAPPTVRCYGWQPNCLSLGYGQRAREADPIALAQQSIDLVRRPTGGRAVLHGDELTYSIALPARHPLAQGNVIESYRRISTGLLRALHIIGIAVQARPQTPKEDTTPQPIAPICFEAVSDYEITVSGRKLIGSAQMRRQGAILQHGSLPLNGDLSQICDLLKYDDETERALARDKLAQHALTLAQAFNGRLPSRDSLINAFLAGFEEAFTIHLVHGTITLAETTQARYLEKNVYGNENWTFRR